MKLVVGLGNPGRKYEGTRHNIGFDVVAELARRAASPKPKIRFQSDVTEISLGQHAALLLTPNTFMNLSGNSVGAAVDFFKLPLADLLVICDDWNLPLATLRFRAKGSAGGQKGLADVIRRLGTEEFARLRIGIGAPPEKWDPAEYVLSRFAKNEVDEMKIAVAKAADACVVWANEGVNVSANRYNGI